MSQNRTKVPKLASLVMSLATSYDDFTVVYIDISSTHHELVNDFILVESLLTQLVIIKYDRV